MRTDSLQVDRENPGPLAGAGAAPTLQGGNALRVELADSLDGLLPYAHAWDSLAAEAPQHVPMLSHAWVSSFLEHRVGPDESWQCVLASRGARLVGALVAIRSQRRRLGLSRTVLRAPEDPHSFGGDLLLAAGEGPETLGVLLHELRRSAPRYWSLELRRVRTGSATLAGLDRRRLGVRFIRRIEETGSAIRVIGTFEQYLETLGRQFRRNLRKSGNRLAALGPFTYRFLAGREAGVAPLEEFLTVEHAGWKGEGGSSISSNAGTTAFYRTLVQRLAARGWLEWHFLDSGGRAVAGQLAVRLGESLIVLKIGYDESLSYVSPGNLLFQETLRRAFATGDTKEVNCLTDMPWHRNWDMDQVPYHHVQFFRSAPLPLLLGYGRALLRERARLFLRPRGQRKAAIPADGRGEA